MDLDQIDQATRPALISVDVAARVFGISKSAAYLSARKGELDSLRVGGRLLVRSAPVREMLRLPPVGSASATA